MRSNTAELNGLTADPVAPPDGCIWYRSDLKEYRIRRDGGTEVLASAPLYVVAGRTTGLNTPSAFAAIGFDSTKEESDDTKLSHDPAVNNSRITALQAGIYLFDFSGYYETTTFGAQTEIEMIFAKNGVNIAGSSVRCYNYAESGKEDFTLGHIHYPIVLAVNDYVEVMHKELQGSGKLKLNALLSAHKM